ncbi:MAG TPA: S9 family peptidase [Thermoanaerobaculia bacterium]
MKRLAVIIALTTAPLIAQVPSNLVSEGAPPFPPELAAKTAPYLEARSAAFSSWHPQRVEMLVSTRFGDTPQVHLVKFPGGDRRQLTFFSERVTGGRFLPGDPNSVIFSSDIGGSENFQLYRLNRTTGEVAMLTDGKSRNVDSIISDDGKWIVFGSNKRNGNDIDVWTVDPSDAKSAKMLAQFEGGGWGASNFSPDDKQLLLEHEISANEAEVWLLDIASGTKRQISTKKAANGGSRFSRDGKSVYYVTDDLGEFLQLVKQPLDGSPRQNITNNKWDLEAYALSFDGTKIAYTTNENGIEVLHIIDTNSGAALATPKLPAGTMGGLSWHRNNKLLGFTFTSAKSPADAYSYDVTTGELQRWTESETGGLDPSRFVEPQLITVKSFDGIPVSAFVYHPDAAKFPGKRPVILNIHGGPEGQSQAGFLGRNNYWINELGIAVVYPNVRGSTGYGKTFLAMDNGFKREDTVKDIGAILDWIGTDPSLDASRVAVYGGSYGGYMSLATMTHYNDRMRAGVDLVGISNFLTFLQNTSGYRRDLRRVEYGDERDPKMHAFLEQISPQASASKINKPMFIIAGFNDPRVPWTEGEQMVKTIRGNGGPVWWLMAKDEGHGFAKKKNADFQFLAMTEFWQEYLLK